MEGKIWGADQMARTMVEKIFAAHASEGAARAGEIVTLHPDVVMLNDISGPVAFDTFNAMGATRVFDPDRVVLVADHFSPAKDVQSAELIRVLQRSEEHTSEPTSLMRISYA